VLSVVLPGLEIRVRGVIPALARAAFDETVLMIVVMRVGHAPAERWADGVKGL
jgi:hypothetical protein